MGAQAAIITTRHRGSAAAAVLAAMAMLAAGCASGSDVAGSAAPTTTVAPAVGAPAPTRYRATGMVLEAPDRGPQFCLGAIDLSLPPGCQGLPLTNWDWGAVADEQARAGVTWGEYRLTGTFDGTGFTLTEPPTVAPPPPTRAFDGLRTPCPEPHNGYLNVDPPRATEANLAAAVALARQRPDLGGLWIDDPAAPRSDGSIRLGHKVLNASFTGDLDARRAELQSAWGGFVCVSPAQRTLADLGRIQAELSASPPPGLTLLSSGVSEPENRVTISVVLAPEGIDATLDARFGAGAVAVESALKAVV